MAAPARVRLGIEELTLPGDEDMGLVGASYLVGIGIGNGIAVGPAAYGAVSGRRGGLFTTGIEAAWQQRIAGPLAVELGFFAGGGGGGSAPVGGGLMLRPHADLLWDFGPVQAGVSWSRVRFPNGAIDSRQLGLVLAAKTDFRYLPRDARDAGAATGNRSGVGFDRIHAVIGAYDPADGARRVDGTALDSTIGIVGARAEQAIGERLYWGIEAAGAASGGVAGYAEALGTLGAETSFMSDALKLGARVALGMGGGGQVDVGGGLLMKAGVHATARLAPNFGVSIEGGAMHAPQGTFKGRYAAASLLWVLDDPRQVGAAARAVRSEWVTGIERYDAQRTDGTRRELRALTLKARRFVSTHVYLSGEAHSAYEGGAGGYIAGLVGAGLQARLVGGLHAGVEALAGAAGGGGVNTRGGAVVQPGAYLGFDLGRSFALRAGVGRIRSVRSGGLDANVVELSAAFTFGVAERVPR